MKRIAAAESSMAITFSWSCSAADSPGPAPSSNGEFFPFAHAMLIETHAHLDYPDFANDFDDVLRRATDAGVTRIITIGKIGLDYHHLPSVEAAKQKHIQVFNALQSETEEQVEARIEDGAYKSKQAELFEQLLDLAAALRLNVVIHQRDAWDNTLEILRDYGRQVSGVFHCFGGTLDQANEVIDLGHLVSFTGIVTFKNGKQVREVAAQVPLDKFMVETDCPYLAPVPFRGKRCEPAYTRLVAEEIALARGVSLEEIAGATTATAEEFFRFERG